MSVYDQIAQGITPIGRDLPQVAGMLDAKNRFQQLRQFQQEEIAYGRGRDRMADERQARLDSMDEETRHARETAMIAQWALATGEPRAVLDELPEVTAKLDEGQVPWREWDEAQAGQFFQNVLVKHGPKAGIAPPQPKEAELPTSYRESMLARNDPEYADFLERSNASKAPRINVGPQVVESEADKAFGKLEGEGLATFIERGNAAADKAASLRAMRENPSITGPTQDVRASATALFADLGIPVAPERLNQLSNLAQYKGIANQLVLTEQLKQKGPQTESDAKRIAESFGKTTNLQEANKLIVNYQLAVADREALLADMADEYKNRTGKVSGWQKEIRQYVQSTPLAGINPQSKRLVFWNEFVEQMREHNPGMGEEEIMDVWRSKYAGR